MDKRTKTTRQTVTTQWTKNKDNQTNSDHTMDKRTKTTRQRVIHKTPNRKQNIENSMRLEVKKFTTKSFL
jgi:hypothetical protein